MLQLLELTKFLSFLAVVRKIPSLQCCVEEDLRSLSEIAVPKKRYGSLR